MKIERHAPFGRPDWSARFPSGPNRTFESWKGSRRTRDMRPGADLSVPVLGVDEDLGGCSDVYTFTKNRMEITSEQVVQEVDVHQEPHGNNIGAGGAGACRRSKLAVARISRPRPNHQKPSRGVAARL